MLRKALDKWVDRHRNPVSFWLHALGIPACLVAAPVLLVIQHWASAAACFATGYALQFLGHMVQGNRSEEELLVRRLLRRR